MIVDIMVCGAICLLPLCKVFQWYVAPEIYYCVYCDNVDHHVMHTLHMHTPEKRVPFNEFFSNWSQNFNHD